VNPHWVVRTAHTVMRPVGWQDLPMLRALKADPRVFAMMLGGVRSPLRTAEELAEDLVLWGARGVGMWSVRDRDGDAFLGIAGLMERPDGLGTALRFAFWPEARGRGIARETAGAALRFAHDEARIARVVAVARADNFASRTVLGAIGMVERGSLARHGRRLLLYASERSAARPATAAGRGPAVPPTPGWL
jgi:RimJ/RimL family protein N-acetyltransferase